MPRGRPSLLQRPETLQLPEATGKLSKRRLELVAHQRRDLELPRREQARGRSGAVAGARAAGDVPPLEAVVDGELLRCWRLVAFFLICWS